MSLTARHASLALTLLASACGSTTVPAADATAPRDVTTDAATPSPDVSDASVDVRDATSDVSQPRCPGGVAMPYPEAPDEVTELSAVPDMTFETASGTLSLHDWYAPCAATPKLLVIRTLAAWSGPSQYAAEHTQRSGRRDNRRSWSCRSLPADYR